MTSVLHSIYQDMAWFGILYELELETNHRSEGPFRYHAVWNALMALTHLSKHIQNISRDYPCINLPTAVLAGLVIYTFLGCATLIFSFWHIRQLCSQVKIVVSTKDNIVASSKIQQIPTIPGYVSSYTN